MSQKEARAKPRRAPPLGQPNALVPSEAVVWVRISPSQVMSAVVVALLSAAVVCGAFFVLWQVRAFVSWFVIAVFVAAVLNPVVNWLQRRHRFVKRPLAIVLAYLGLAVALLFMVAKEASASPKVPAKPTCSPACASASRTSASAKRVESTPPANECTSMENVCRYGGCGRWCVSSTRSRTVDASHPIVARMDSAAVREPELCGVLEALASAGVA